MRQESSYEPSVEIEPKALDISDRVAAIMDSNSPRAVVELHRLMHSLEVTSAHALKVTLQYTTLSKAKWAKSFLESAPKGQQRTAAIRATEAQAKEAANVFASGVEWIQIEE